MDISEHNLRKADQSLSYNLFDEYGLHIWIFNIKGNEITIDLKSGDKWKGTIETFVGYHLSDIFFSVESGEKPRVWTYGEKMKDIRKHYERQRKEDAMMDSAIFASKVCPMTQF